MLGVAAVGLIVNLIAMRVLVGGKDDSLNVTGAYLEVWADMLGSVGIIGAAILVYITGWSWVGPIVAIAIGLWVLPRTWILLRNTANILLQGVPRDMDLDAVRTAMRDVPGVTGAHDLHLWSVAGDDRSLIAHAVVTADAAAQSASSRVAAMLRDRYAIDTRSSI